MPPKQNKSIQKSTLQHTAPRRITASTFDTSTQRTEIAQTKATQL